MCYTRFDNAVKASHILLGEYLKDGMDVLDMTMGNGQDCFFMLEKIGQKGLLYAFDIQKEALENTKKILNDFSSDNYSLILDSHENCDKYVMDNSIDAVIFNLGYLPCGNKEIYTRPETTLIALEKSLRLLKRCGVIFLVSYIMHDQGKEHAKIMEYIGLLEQRAYNVFVLQYANQKNDPPVLTVIEKR